MSRLARNFAAATVDGPGTWRQVAPPAAPNPPSPSRPDLATYVARLVTVAVGLSAVVYGYQALLDTSASRFIFHFPVRYFLYGAIFLTATTWLRRREWTMAAVALVCLEYLHATCPPLVPYMVALVPTLYFLLGNDPRPGHWQCIRFWAGLIFGLVLLPKIIQTYCHLEHGSWLDVNQNLFVGLFLRYAYYFYERRRGLVLPGQFWEHVSYLLFVPQITGMLNFPPSEMAGRWGFEFRTLRRGFASAGWAALEIPVVLWLEQRVLPAWGYSRGYAALRGAPVGAVWICLLASYLYWALLVSTKFNLMVALFRFFGVNVDDNFNWPLLSTSPIQLWRRWNIYNRRLLLKFVYFPLGGNRRWVYRNIMLTFVASALLLHTGYLGSPWLGVDPGQLRDWLLYFSAQGLLVCAAYWWHNRPFWERLPEFWRWTLAGVGWMFTLLSSAWLHVLPLAAGDLLNMNAAPVDSLSQRLALMGKALGF